VPGPVDRPAIDVTVTVPERDRYGKLANRGADGCHLGYDARRGPHFVYVESLQRLGTFIITEWRKASFTLCKRISADTPADYFDAKDLPIAPVTAAMLPRRYTAHSARSVGRHLAILMLGWPEVELTASRDMWDRLTASTPTVTLESTFRQPICRFTVSRTPPFRLSFHLCFRVPRCTGVCVFVPCGIFRGTCSSEWSR
jgi:hypothetical protein